jgi:hypothetical protein
MSEDILLQLCDPLFIVGGKYRQVHIMKKYLIYSPPFLPLVLTNHATTIERLLGSAAKRLLKFVNKKANDKTAQINQLGDPE